MLTLPTNRGTCFSLRAILNAFKMMDSCTVRAQFTLCFCQRETELWRKGASALGASLERAPNRDREAGGAPDQLGEHGN